MINDQFVPYEIALKLKEKKFYDRCIGVYQIHKAKPIFEFDKLAYYEIETYDEPKLCIEDSDLNNNIYKDTEEFNGVKWGAISAPLWQQVIHWFKVVHKIYLLEQITFDPIADIYCYTVKKGQVYKPTEIHEDPIKAKQFAIEYALTLI